MGDPVGAHITRIYVNCPRSSPSPIRSSNTAPVCTSTPIAPGLSNNPSPQQKMAQIAKEAVASQRGSETFIRKPETPPLEKFLFVSKESGQAIDFNTGDGLGKLNPTNVPTLSKKKKKRHTLAVVPPAITAPCPSKAADDGDNLVPLTTEMRISETKRKTNFTSYDGIQMFTFTLDDD